MADIAVISMLTEKIAAPSISYLFSHITQAPYMHNGVFRTMEQVIDFYNKSGGVGAGLKVQNQTLDPAPLNLNQKEKTKLIAFIKILNSI